MTVDAIISLSLHPGITERRVAGLTLSEALGLKDLGEISGDDAPPSGAALIVQAETFSPDDAARVAQLRAASAAPIILRFRSLSGIDPAWFERHQVSAVPRDLSNGLTVAACVRTALAQPTRLRRYAGVRVGGSGELSDFLAELSSDIDEPGSRVVMGVLSQPRSGSKALADMLCLWAAPLGGVFHGHGASDRRRLDFEAQQRRALDAGDAETLRSARMKLGLFAEMRRKMAAASRLTLFLAERDPLSRLDSSFGMSHRKILADFLHGRVPRHVAQSRLDAYAERSVGELSRWYDVEFGAFGFTPDDVAMAGRDYVIARTDQASLVVLRTETREPLLRQAGIWSDLVSSNSAAERGYAPAREMLGREIAVRPEVIQQLYASPWIAAMHGSAAT